LSSQHIFALNTLKRLVKSLFSKFSFSGWLEGL